jgi:predicted transposase YbfD/YdcC
MEAATLLDYFRLIPDPRVQRTRKHELPEILFIALAAVICGAECWTQVEEYAKANRDWLERVLDLPNGIPSHDTLGRVFAALDPDALEAVLQAFVRDLAGDSAGKHIAIDGKTLRRSFDRAAEQNAIHMVTAWVHENHAAFGQVKVDEKSNEITAVPKLLELLNLQEATVTIDAMGCQKEIAEQIVAGGGDYLLALKGNQGTLHDEVSEFFDDVLVRGLQAPLATHKSLHKDHGRIEERRVWVSTEVAWLRDAQEWEGLSAIVAVQSTRTIKGESTTERRHYICSADKSAEELGQLIRQHWSVENELHWTLDVAFREDDCRVRVQHAAENLARIRRLALSLLKQDKTTKAGIHAKRLKAAWSRNYLLKILKL